MQDELKLLGGAMVTLALATSALVVVPHIQLKSVEAPAQLKPYTAAQLRGRQVYIENGCIYCHSQQPRDRAQAPDDKRGWGRASVAADYYYDKPHLLGTMRTGPDLFNIGVRQPSADWHLGHLYQPRAYVHGSIMPSYPFLFDIKDKEEAGDRVVNLPPGYAPAGKIVVAKPEVMDLVAYLQGLDHSYPVLPAPEVKK
ncbi:cbb3-type cytochrome c oxidase subunit II [Pseudoduganella sp. UC29_106]|uniref:cbb3-type cytochrome c oxidase subunit II n=1 Tax=Pseudoduganella sp. UC29_106 TaxID=3374553 RepID=UPI0037579EAB